MSVVLAILAFLVTAMIVVTVHEFGHYLVARWSGVTVLRFSIGFGRPLFMVTDSRGTEWAFAPILLGGYVRMMDRDTAKETTGLGQVTCLEDVSLGKRFSIIAAGPIANFILAMAIYFAIAMFGELGIKPIVGDVYDDTPAQRAGFLSGDIIQEVDGAPVLIWNHVLPRLVRAASEHGEVRMVVSDDQRSFQEERLLDLSSMPASALENDFLRNIGISPDDSFLLTELAEVVPGFPAETAGLQEGDVVIAIDGEVVERWGRLSDKISDSPGREMEFIIWRNGDAITTQVTPDAVELADGEVSGRVGIRPVIDEQRIAELRVVAEVGVTDALASASRRTIDSVVVTFQFIKLLFSGEVSTAAVSGPVRLAGYAKDNAEAGISSFLAFIAGLSISIGAINLLPVPLLDGGRLVIYVVEFICNRPLPENLQRALQGVGFALLVAAIFFVMINDFWRL